MTAAAIPDPNCRVLGSPTFPYFPASTSVDSSDIVDPESDAAMEIHEEDECYYFTDVRQYYPIRIGEVLNQRYLIDHKLGHGGFSTVWLAYDLEDHRDVAIKIIVSGPWGQREGQIQTILRRALTDSSHLVLYRDVFLLRGESAEHYAFIYPFLGPSLGSLELIQNPLPIATCMSVARDLLQQLAHLHQAGFVHRDLNLNNVLLGIAIPKDLSIDSKYKLYGRPVRTPLPNTLWRPGEYCSRLQFPKQLYTREVYLADFGLAMKVGDSDIPSGLPASPYRSPERDHGAAPNFSCDMWAYMCIFSFLYLGTFPFYGLNAVTDYMGPLPPYLRGKYLPVGDSKDEWYDPTRKPAVKKRPNHVSPARD